MKQLSPSQIRAAYGKVFTALRVIDGCSEVRFYGVFPSGNVGVKRSTDPECFGPITVSVVQAEPLFAAIERRFNSRGFTNIHAVIS